MAITVWGRTGLAKGSSQLWPIPEEPGGPSAQGQRFQGLKMEAT